MSLLTRKKFIISSVAGAAGMVLLPQIVTAQQTQMPVKQQKAPPLDRELVKEFVSVAHKDFDKVKSMLRENPDLLKCGNLMVLAGKRSFRKKLVRDHVFPPVMHLIQKES